jgi:hypothetical protein
MEPLEMNHSAASFVRLKDSTNIIAPHHKRKTQSNQTLPKPTFDAAAFIPVNDLSKWAIMQMNNGNGTENKQLFLQNDEMWHCKLLFQLKRQLYIPISMDMG